MIRWFKLLSNYDLGVPTVVAPIQNTPSKNLVVRITTEKGDFAAKIFLKRPNETSIERLNEIDSALERIARYEVDVPKSVKTLDSQPGFEIDGFPVKISRYIYGNPFDDNDDYLPASSARLLAAIHHDLRNFDFENPPWLLPLGNQKLEQLSQEIASIQKIKTDNHDENIHAAIKYAPQIIQKGLENEIKLQKGGYWDFPSSVITGGYLRKHLFCHWHSVIGIVDFELMRREARIVDIALVVEDYLIDDYENQQFKTSGNLKNFIKAYRQVTDLSDGELSSIPSVLVGLKIGDCLYWIRRAILDSVKSFANVDDKSSPYNTITPGVPFDLDAHIQKTLEEFMIWERQNSESHLMDLINN